MEEDRKTRKEEDQPRRANTEIQYPRMTDQRNREGKSNNSRNFPRVKDVCFQIESTTSVLTTVVKQAFHYKIEEQ